MAERRGLLNRLTGLASRELSPQEQAQWDDLTAKVENIDQRLTALEDEEQSEVLPSGNPLPEQNGRARGVGRRTAPWMFESEHRGGQSKDNQVLRS